MPTHDEDPLFLREFAALSTGKRARFLDAMRKMVLDLKAGPGFRPGLRVKAIQGHAGIFEMTWAPDGRATFEFGPEVRPGNPHIIWRRIGGHDILTRP